MISKQRAYFEIKTYNPDPLLDALASRLQVKSDAGLARKLEMNPPAISKIRHRVIPVTAETLLRMHDVSGLPVNDLRKLMGVPTVDRQLQMEAASV